MKRETVPSWLELLLAAQFFTTCANHLLVSRNECNLFCTQCEATPAAFCNYCRSINHSNHRVIQVRIVQLCSQWKGKTFHISYMSYNSKLYDLDVFSLVTSYATSQLRNVIKLYIKCVLNLGV